MRVDGDSAVEFRVVPEVLERIIEDEDLPKSIIDTYSEIVAKRAPSVRITFKADQ